MTATMTEVGVGSRQCGARTTMTRRRMTTDVYGVIVGGPPPFWDDNNDNDNDDDTDNDEDVEGLCFQRMHAHHRRRAEAVLTLQPRDGGGERMLCQAHHVAPRAGEWGQGQIGRGGGYTGHNNNNGNYDDNTHTRNNHINI